MNYDIDSSKYLMKYHSEIDYPREYFEIKRELYYDIDRLNY